MLIWVLLSLFTCCAIQSREKRKPKDRARRINAEEGMPIMQEPNVVYGATWFFNRHFVNNLLKFICMISMPIIRPVTVLYTCSQKCVSGLGPWQVNTCNSFFRTYNSFLYCLQTIPIYNAFEIIYLYYKISLISPQIPCNQDVHTILESRLNSWELVLIATAGT